MNIDHLKLFVRIASLKNISKAGRELGLSAAVSSTHVNKLENQLGVKLIHRTTRQVSLTEEGKTFLPHAVEILDQIKTAKASIGVGQWVPQGKLRITAPASFGRMHIIPALSDFLSAYPEIRIDLRLSDGMTDLVEGGFDLAIRNASLNDSSLMARKLCDDQRIVCASPEYLAQHGEPKTPEALLKHKCIHLIGLDTWSFMTPDGEQNIKTTGVIAADNGEAIRDLCVDGIGITINSVWSAYEKLRSGELIPILKDYPLISNTALWAVYPSTRLLAPKVRVFIDFFAKRFGHSPPWESAY